VGMCSSYSFSTSALDGVEWSASRPGSALTLGKGPPVPIVQEAGRASEPVWTQRIEEKSFPLCRQSNLDRPVVQPVARQYIDGTTWLTTNSTDDIQDCYVFLSSGSIVSDYGLDDRGLIPGRGKGFFLYPLCPDRLWGPPSLLYNGYRGVLSPGVKRGWGVTLTTHPHLVPRS
jgi:hypothetical protein